MRYNGTRHTTEVGTTKPVSYTHLDVYKRQVYNTEPGSEEIHLGDLILNKDQKQMYVNGEEVRLTSTEYKIVELLM